MLELVTQPDNPTITSLGSATSATGSFPFFSFFFSFLHAPRLSHGGLANQIKHTSSASLHLVRMATQSSHTSSSHMGGGNEAQQRSDSGDWHPNSKLAFCIL